MSFLPLQLKLSAFEAGIGVYGRSGLIIHPVLGNRIRFGGILTDAVLEPGRRLEGFDPCEDCGRCIEMCPAKAFDLTKRYPYSFSQEKCEEYQIFPIFPVRLLGVFGQMRRLSRFGPRCWHRGHFSWPVRQILWMRRKRSTADSVKAQRTAECTRRQKGSSVVGCVG